MTTFGHVPHWDWSHKPVALVAGGPSLVGVDLSPLRGRAHVLAISASMIDLPWADAGFCCDREGFKAWHRALRRSNYPIFWALDDHASARSPNFIVLRRRSRIAALPDPVERQTIPHGGTSGFGGLALASLFSPRQVFLFGFDYCPDGDRWHHNECHYAQIAVDPQFGGHWQRWAERFDVIAPTLLAKGMLVWNCSVRSRVSAFPRISPAEGIERICSAAVSATG